MWAPISSLLLAIPSVIAGFVHPGALSTEQDFVRIATKLNAGESPWVEGYNNLITSRYANPIYVANPVEVICRGENACPTKSADVFQRDVAAAYQSVYSQPSSTELSDSLCAGRSPAMRPTG